MPKPPRLDLRRLERELAAKASTRGARLAPGGRPATGLMDLVRDNLDVLVALQATGSTWDEIAAGLSAQGYTKSDGRFLTGTALTGVISSVRRQERRRVAKAATREARADLPGTRSSVAQRSNPQDTAGPRLRLAPELSANPVPSSADAEAPLSETEIRQLQADKLRHLFKKE